MINTILTIHTKNEEIMKTMMLMTLSLLSQVAFAGDFFTYSGTCSIVEKTVNGDIVQKNQNIDPQNRAPFECLSVATQFADNQKSDEKNLVAIDYRSQYTGSDYVLNIEARGNLLSSTKLTSDSCKIKITNLETGKTSKENKDMTVLNDAFCIGAAETIAAGLKAQHKNMLVEFEFSGRSYTTDITFSGSIR